MASVITGRQFNIDYPKKVFKIICKNMRAHNGFSWNIGMNEDIHDFDPTECCMGGLHVCFGKDVELWKTHTSKRSLVIRAQIPDEAEVAVFDNKIKADKVILLNIVYFDGKHFSGVDKGVVDALKTQGLAFDINKIRRPNFEESVFAQRICVRFGTIGVLFVHGFVPEDLRVYDCVFSGCDHFDLMELGMNDTILAYYVKNHYTRILCEVERKCKYPGNSVVRFMKEIKPIEFGRWIFFGNSPSCLHLFGTREFGMFFFCQKIDPKNYKFVDIEVSRIFSPEDWLQILQVNPGLICIMQPHTTTREMVEIARSAPESEFPGGFEWRFKDISRRFLQ